ncbi:hypothetical protein ABEB36_001249 [Hypothenemus hampei]|uniref:Uncharacterized protein n=1 Tax=Hypothenemus hampei TaxID=57062 RepID=A0ABD1FDX9_HYPHA
MEKLLNEIIKDLTVLSENLEEDETCNDFKRELKRAESRCTYLLGQLDNIYLYHSSLIHNYLELLAILQRYYQNGDLPEKVNYIRYRNLWAGRAHILFKTVIEMQPESTYKGNFKAFLFLYLSFLMRYEQFHGEILLDHARNMALKSEISGDDYVKISYILRGYCNDWEASRIVLLKGRHKYPRDCHIMFEIIHLEKEALRAGIKTVKQSQRISRMNEAFEDAATKNVDVNFLLEMLNYFQANGIDGSINPAKEVLKKYYKDSVEMWHHLAYQGLVKIEQENKTKTVYLCGAIDIYEEGLQVISKKKEPILWTSYIDFIYGIYIMDPDVKLDPANPCLMTIENFLDDLLTKAEKKIKLDKNQLTMWLEVCELNYNRTDTAERRMKYEKICEKGVKAYPKDEHFWIVFFKHLFRIGHFKRANETMQVANYTLGANCIELWHLFIENVRNQLTVKELNEVYVIACTKTKPNVAIHFKGEFMFHLIRTNDYETMLQYYESLSTKQPYCKKMHNDMFEVAFRRANKKLNDTTNLILKRWSEQFGHDDINLYKGKLLVIQAKEISRYEKYLEVNKVFEEAMLKLEDREMKKIFRADFRNYLHTFLRYFEVKVIVEEKSLELPENKP